MPPLLSMWSAIKLRKPFTSPPEFSVKSIDKVTSLMYVFVFLTSTTQKKKYPTTFPKTNTRKKSKSWWRISLSYVLKMWHESEVCWLELSLALTMPFNPKLVNLWLYGLKCEGPSKQPLRPGRERGLGLGVSFKKTGHSEIDGFEQLEKPGRKFRGFANVGPPDLFWSAFLVVFGSEKVMMIFRCKMQDAFCHPYQKDTVGRRSIWLLYHHIHICMIYISDNQRSLWFLSSSPSRIRVFTPHIFNFKIIFESSVWINDSNRYTPWN